MAECHNQHIFLVSPWSQNGRVLSAHIFTRFSLAAVLAVIEMADRPFATLGISQAWFIRGEDPLACPDDDDLETGVVCMTPSLQEKKEKRTEKPHVPGKPEKRKRKTLTKKNPHEPQRRAL